MEPRRLAGMWGQVRGRISGLAGGGDQADPEDYIPEVPEGAHARGLPPARLPSAPAVMATIAAVSVIAILYVARDALSIFLIGIILVYILDGPVTRLTRHGVSRGVATGLVVVVTVFVVLVAFRLVLQAITGQIVNLITSVPELAASISSWYASANLSPDVRQVLDEIAKEIQVVVGSLNLGQVILNLVSGLIGALSGLLVYMILPFFVFYLLVDRPKLVQNMQSSLPPGWRRDATAISGIAIASIGQYIRAEIKLGTVMFVIVWTVMTIFGFLVDPAFGQAALFLGLIAGFFELIPQIGPILSYIPAAILAATISPFALVLVSVTYFIIFNIEGSILVPMIEGRAVDLNGALIIMLIAIGFSLGGIMGAILAIPIAISAREIYRYLFRRAMGAPAPLLEDEVPLPPIGAGPPPANPASVGGPAPA